METPQIASGVDRWKPGPAWLYDCRLGGTTNHPVDREPAERLQGDRPEITYMARADRDLRHRAARWLAAERGIGQFIGVGPGLPTQSNATRSNADGAIRSDSDGSRWGLLPSGPDPARALRRTL